jgi:hypothetical protein
MSEYEVTYTSNDIPNLRFLVEADSESEAESKASEELSRSYRAKEFELIKIICMAEDPEDNQHHQMRLDLAEREAENMNHGQIIDMLIDGCEGYNQMDDAEIRKLWTSLFE